MDTEFMNGYSVNGHKMNSSEGGVDSNVEVQSLREELDRVNAEFLKANEERAKAAEYGLVLLEEKQHLQYKNEEMTLLYERTKQELETSTITLRQVQRDYEKRVKHVERQREELINEMDGRERELLMRVEGLEEERRALERRIKKMSSQHDYISENNGILSSENERLKQEMSVQKDELRIFKRKDQNSETELQKMKEELEASRNKLDKLSQYEQTLDELNEQNQSLQTNLSILQEQCEHVAGERDDLEKQKREIVQTLNEEREAKAFLESKLREGLLRSPHNVSWLAESTSNLAPTTPDALGQSSILHSQVPVSVSAPTSPIPTVEFQTHSTPLSNRRMMVPNLFTEIQKSVSSSQAEEDNREEVLQSTISDLNSKIEVLEAENARLTQTLKDAPSEVEKWKARYKKVKEGKNTEMESLADELSAKKELIGQLKSKLSVAMKEKASFEIEIEGLREEMKRVRESSRLENDKLEKDITEEQNRNGELKGRIAELEEKLGQSINSGEMLETVLVNSTGEVAGMIAEIANLQRAMATLQSENKFTVPDDTVRRNGDTPSNEGLDDMYDISVQEGKKRLKVLKDNHTVEEVSRLKELLRQLRDPLEVFTKKMLESSLAVSSKHMITGIASAGEVSIGRDRAKINEEDGSAHKINELESNLNKMRARLANRTEEVNQLRAIMKARQTTVDVTVSSLKSKLEGQRRNHEAEINQLKHKLKTLRKERDEQISLGALTSRRCQEYLEEISRVKRKLEEQRGESDQLRSESKLLSVYLERAIKQKLEVSQELERYREEEERTRVIPLTLSASRV